MYVALLLTLLIKPSDDFTKVWDSVESAIRNRYYAREQRRVEMDVLLRKYAPEAKAAQTRGQFEEVVESMIHDFHDSHFDFLSTSDQGYYLMDGLARAENADKLPEFGAWFEKALDGYRVRMVLDGTEAATVGLRKGDVVKTIDGQPFTPIDSLRSKVGSKVDLGIDRNGVIIHANVAISLVPCMDMFLDASNASAKIIDDRGKKIGYFHLWTQANDRFKNALSAAVYGKLRSTDAFVLDLRDGFGGRPEGYGDPFFRPELWIDWNSTSKSGFKELFGYQRPMVVLINSGSRSAKEILSLAFKESHRATLVGRTTAGNVLGTFPQRIADWAYIEIPVVDVVVDGTRLEGKGVDPDIRVDEEADLKGNDLDLRAALEKLKNVKPYQPDPSNTVAGV